MDHERVCPCKYSKCMSSINYCEKPRNNPCYLPSCRQSGGVGVLNCSGWLVLGRHGRGVLSSHLY